jgi:hypothetical protein
MYKIEIVKSLLYGNKYNTKIMNFKHILTNSILNIDKFNNWETNSTSIMNPSNRSKDISSNISTTSTKNNHNFKKHKSNTNRDKNDYWQTSNLYKVKSNKSKNKPST